MERKRHGRLGMLMSLIVMALVVTMMSGCESAGAGASGGSGSGGGTAIAGYPAIPGSVLGASGGGGVSPTSARIRTLAEDYLGQAELLEEYNGFMMVPETGMNYNDNMAMAFPTLQQWAQDYRNGVGDWRQADSPYDIELDFKFDPQTETIRSTDDPQNKMGTFRATEDFSHYEIVLNGDDGTRFHYEVREYEDYTHGFMYGYLTSGNPNVDTVDIVTTDDWTFTKVVRIFNLDGTMDVTDDGSPDDHADVQIFAGINRNDTHERVLGVKRQGSYTLPTDGSDPTYEPDNWEPDGVGAFDAVQLAIRPDTRPASPALWYDGYPDSEFPAQGETFDSALFPSESDVRLLFDVGINPGVVGQWVIDSDLSRDYNFPEWDPSSISFSEITP